MENNKSTQVEELKPAEQPIEMKLVDIPVADENTALNLLVGFISVAHKRGVFTLEESSKIWECVKKFQKPA
jgi:hypothetical protein